MDRWLRHAVADTVRPVTIAEYGQIVRNHAKPALGRPRPQTLTSKLATGDTSARGPFVPTNLSKWRAKRFNP